MNENVEEEIEREM